MDITAEITGLKYTPCSSAIGKEIDFEKFDINQSPSTVIIRDKNFAVSKWVSPKRTRSYPFERVYNSLCYPKRITVIPVIKDEGADGDRDFIQWDTISMMSLLEVFVIFGYYETAQLNSKNRGKITNQKFNNNYIKLKINEISRYHSSALHWNLYQVSTVLPELIEKTKQCYQTLSRDLKVKFHNFDAIDKLQNQFMHNYSKFIEYSRDKAEKAQQREKNSIQPKESLDTYTKASITIKNFLGGLYFFTTDEVKVEEKRLYLIEDKHSSNSKIPQISDIKDGLLKMVLYSNLKKLKSGDKEFICEPVLKLTSANIAGEVTSKSPITARKAFFEENSLTKRQTSIMETLFIEADTNNFSVILKGSQ